MLADKPQLVKEKLYISIHIDNFPTNFKSKLLFIFISLLALRRYNEIRGQIEGKGLVLIINESAIIGKGAHRVCYFHPSDSSLCVKVVFRQDIDQKAIRREIEYYQRLEKRDISFAMLSKYVDEVKTNLGRAHVYELIKDADGQVSKPLSYYLNSASLSKQFAKEILQSVENLHHYLIEQRLLTLTLYPRNLVLQLDGSPKLVIIDDIGNTEYVRLSEMSTALGLKKVKRKWMRFIKHLQQKYPNNQLVTKICEKY